MIDLYIHGEPKAQPRPRATFVNGTTRIYDPGTANAWKALVRSEVLDAWTEYLRPPYKVEMQFRFKRPVSHYRTGKHADKLKADAPIYHVHKPDADNLAKPVLDAITDLGLWKDEEVTHLTVEKDWTPVSGCRLVIANHR